MKNKDVDNLRIFLGKFICLNYRGKEKGNTLIVSIIIGLLTVGISALALVTSSKGKTQVQADQYTKQAVATSELGVNRTVDKLASQYPYYLTLDYDPDNSLNEWQNIPDDSLTSDTLCSVGSTGGDVTTAVINEVVDSNRSYEVQSYIWDSTSSIGTLELLGTNDDGGLNSQSQIEVALNIEQVVPPNSFPGLYAEVLIDVGNNQIRSGANPDEPFNIICTDCRVASNNTYWTDTGLAADCADGNADQYLQEALGVNDISSVDGTLVIGLPKLPDYPEPPSKICSATQAPPCFYILPKQTTTGANVVNATVPKVTDVNQRKTWIATPGTAWYGKLSYLSEPYIYFFDNNGNPHYNSFIAGSLTGDTASVTISTTDSILGAYMTANGIANYTINKKVRLYVTGNISLAGGSSTEYLTHNGTLEKFAILGCTDELYSAISTYLATSPATTMKNCKKKTSYTNNPYEDQVLKLNGQAPALDVFIYAPNSTAGINGGGTFDAVIWASKWDMSSGSTATINIPASAESLLSSEFGFSSGSIGVPKNRIDKISLWRREAAN